MGCVERVVGVKEEWVREQTKKRTKKKSAKI